jgi:hypothetical protein
MKATFRFDEHRSLSIRSYYKNSHIKVELFVVDSYPAGETTTGVILTLTGEEAAAIGACLKTAAGLEP